MSAPFSLCGCTSGSSMTRRPERLKENQPSTISMRQKGSSPAAENGGGKTQVVVSSGPVGPETAVSPPTVSVSPVAVEDPLGPTPTPTFCAPPVAACPALSPHAASAKTATARTAIAGPMPDTILRPETLGFTLILATSHPRRSHRMATRLKSLALPPVFRSPRRRVSSQGISVRAQDLPDCFRSVFTSKLAWLQSAIPDDHSPCG